MASRVGRGLAVAPVNARARKGVGGDGKGVSWVTRGGARAGYQAERMVGGEIPAERGKMVG
eukprot:scaffold1187_cov71-Isochrysis_galbana.AAC.2